MKPRLIELWTVENSNFSQVAELVDASRFYRLDGCIGEIADNREDSST